MKLPYIKLYTADLLAASRNLTAEQVGAGIMSICELAFENDTAYDPQTAREITFFEMLTRWKEEAQEAYHTNQKKMKKARKSRWQKNENTVGQSLKNDTTGALTQHTETNTETEPYTETKTETEDINISTVHPAGAQDTPPSLPAQPTTTGPATKNNLQAFAREVLVHFEPPLDKKQQDIWFKRNCRCLKDILIFCHGDIPLALNTIEICLAQVEKAGFSAGYEAVLRNITNYYTKAKQQNEAGTNYGH